MECLPRAQGRARDGFAVDKSAVGRIAISDFNGISAKNNFAMARRNCGVFELEIIRRCPAKSVETQLQMDDLSVKTFRFN